MFAFQPPRLQWARTSHVVEGGGHLGQQVVGALEAGAQEALVDLQRLLVQLQLQVHVGQEQRAHPVHRQGQRHQLKHTGRQ